MKKFFLCFLFLVLVAGFQFALVKQTGTLKGNVVDSESMIAIPGVKVTIKSPAMMVPSMEAVTNREGFFRYINIPTGKYAVTFELDGFKTLVRTGIIVNAGASVNLTIKMETSPIRETITVTGQSPTVDAQTSNITAVIDGNFIDSLPNVRVWENLMNYAPGIVGGGSPIVHGSSSRENNFSIDGINMTDPETGAQNADINFDIIEEAAIQTGGMPAEHGTTGGIINIITKSGGDKFSGTISLYHTREEFQASTLHLKDTPWEGDVSGADWEWEPSITFGGPLKRSKIWFFLSASVRKEQTWVPGYPVDNPDLQQPLDRERWHPFGKLTFQLNPQSKLILAVNWYEHRRNHRDASDNRTIDATIKQLTVSPTYNAHYTRTFGDNFIFNAKFGAWPYNLNLWSKHKTARMDDDELDIISESNGWDDLYWRTRLQFYLDGTLYVDDWLGSHEIKAGIEAEHSHVKWHDINHNNPDLGYGPEIHLDDGVPDYVVMYEDVLAIEKKIGIRGYLQDSWNVSDRLTLNVGLSLDYQHGYLPPQGAEREPITFDGVVYDSQVYETITIIDWLTLNPRFGLTYDITGDGKTIFKATAARMHHAALTMFFEEANPNGLTSWRYDINPDWTLDLDRGMYRFSPAAASTFDKNIKSPYMDEITVGLERELFEDWRIGVRYIHKDTKRMIEDVDLNSVDLDALMRGDDIWTVWKNWEPINVVDPFDNATVTFWNQIENLPLIPYLTNPPGADRTYDGVELTLTKRFSHGWQLMASYVYCETGGLIGIGGGETGTDSYLFNSPNAHIHAYGNFDDEIRHQFKLHAMIKGPWGINLSGYWSIISGRRWERRLRSTDDVFESQFEALGLEDGELSQGRETIRAEALGTRAYDTQQLLDLRLEKTFRIKNVLISVFADVFNVFDAAPVDDVNEVSSGYLQNVSGTRVPYGGMTGIYDSPRETRIGVKIKFN